MTNYFVKVYSRKLRRFITYKKPFTDRAQAEHVLRRELFKQFGHVFITPLNKGLLFVDSMNGYKVGEIIVVEAEDVHAKVDRIFFEMMEEYRNGSV